jgi:HEAT repeat protein
VSDDRNLGWFQTQQIFDMIEGSIALNMIGLNDPRGGDSLASFIEKKPHIHWQTRASFSLAKVGDLRGVPTMAKRLRMDPLKIYSDDTDFEMALKRDDNERVVAARMIADLAQLYPDKAEQLREQAEDALIFWIHELPSPHANGLRALSAMGSTKDIEALRKWAKPTVPLPKEGQQPPMPEEWVVAQSAMRYIGWLKDDQAARWFEEALKKRPKEVDVTMDSLMSGGLAVIGMALKSLGTGASMGMAQMGDPKSFKPLLKYIEGPKENEQSRMDACAALAWVATPEDMVTVAKKIQEYNKPEKSHQFVRACLLETLITRPIPGTAPELIKLINLSSEPTTRHQAARAVGKAGLTPEVENQLFELMKDEALMIDAALALMLGGNPATAARAVAMLSDRDKSAIEELQELWYFTFGYWSDEDLEKGRIFRWVDNAVAISHVQIRQTPQEWATAQLERQFDNLYFDNGPHSFTRVVLRVRLLQMARSPDKERREGAIRTMLFMKEQGLLLTLRDDPGEVGKYASEAYHDLLNPKILTGVKEIADDKAKQQQQQQP